MAQNTGTLISAAIRPNDDTDLIASAFQNEIKGGVHSYATLTERNNIIADRRQFGMLCVVYNDGANNGIYQLKNINETLTDNTNWVKSFATLVDGKIDVTELPAITIIDTHVVNSEGEMLSLSAQQGDVAVRIDESKTYILSDNNPTNLSSWIELKSPTELPDLITAGSVGSATHIPIIAYDSKGRITSTSTQPLELPDLITAGSVGSSASIPVITYDNKGRITDVVSVNVNIPSNVINQGGNSYGATVSIGTNDNQPITLKSNNRTFYTLQSSTSSQSTHFFEGDNKIALQGIVHFKSGTNNNFLRFRNDNTLDYQGQLNIESSNSGGGVNFITGLARFVNIGNFRVTGMNIATAGANVFKTVYNLLNDDFVIGSTGVTISNNSRLDIRVPNSFSTQSGIIVSDNNNNNIFRVDNKGLLYTNRAIIGTTISDGSLLQLNGTASVLNVNGNSANNTIFRVSGSSGELFSVVDSLTGSLMSVNDISGLPIFEVFSDSSILMGDTNYPSYNTTRRIVTVTGSNTIISLTQSLYDGVFVDYVARRDTNVRAGNLIATYFGSTISTAEYTTSDIGDTSGLIIDANISGGNINVYASASSANWIIKTIIRSI